jgi:8-oxo-dGTP pyrophosphatase MutT (NUDIX family)
MNKKIYLNDKYILLTTDISQISQDQAIKHYQIFDEEAEEIKKLVADFVEPANHFSIAIEVKSTKAFIKELRKHFQYIEAAGGFIENSGKYLFIHRHGRWDLPKGKLEKKETIEAAAVRECEEECGIKNLTITGQLSSTFHIYAHKGGFALKQTYWFYMISDFSNQLLPQTEEDIDQVKWFDRQEIEEIILGDTYYTISDVVKEAMAM